MKENEDCTYLFDEENRTLYVSLSFKDLTHLDECKDYFKVNVDTYKSQYKDDPIKKLIEEVSKWRS